MQQKNDMLCMRAAGTHRRVPKRVSRSQHCLFVILLTRCMDVETNPGPDYRYTVDHIYARNNGLEIISNDEQSASAYCQH